MGEVSLLLRRAAREYLGLKDGDYWPSDVADAQARALIAAGFGDTGQAARDALLAAADALVQMDADQPDDAADWLRARAAAVPVTGEDS